MESNTCSALFLSSWSLLRYFSCVSSWLAHADWLICCYQKALWVDPKNVFFYNLIRKSVFFNLKSVKKIDVKIRVWTKMTRWGNFRKLRSPSLVAFEYCGSLLIIHKFFNQFSNNKYVRWFIPFSSLSSWYFAYHMTIGIIFNISVWFEQ